MPKESGDVICKLCPHTRLRIIQCALHNEAYYLSVEGPFLHQTKNLKEHVKDKDNRLRGGQPRSTPDMGI